MSFLFNLNTKIYTETETKPVMNAINILKRDMAKVFGESDESGKMGQKQKRFALYYFIYRHL